jgi:hypothetical protein
VSPKRRRTKVKISKPGKIDRDTVIALVVLRAMAGAPRGEDLAIRKRLGEAIVASLLAIARAPNPTTDPEAARRNIIVAVRKGVIAAVNPTPRSAGRSRAIAVMTTT